MAIDVNNVMQQMLGAAKGVFADKWPEVSAFAESETKKFAQSMAEIEAWAATGKLTQDEAKSLARLHQRSMKMVLTSVEGISLAVAEKAVNAALDIVRGLINKAV